MEGPMNIIPNDDRGLKQLLKRLTALKPQLIVLEASGGYELLADRGPGRGPTAGGFGQPSGGAAIRRGHREAGQNR